MGIFNIEGELGTVLEYAVLIIGAVLACVAAAWVLKFVLKFIFKHIRFIVCLGIVVVLIGGFIAKSVVSPVQKFLDESGASEAMEAVVEEFKGIYSEAKPYLAWRFTELSDGDVVRIKIDYLPMGSVIASYDKQTGQISIDEADD